MRNSWHYYLNHIYTVEDFTKVPCDGHINLYRIVTTMSGVVYLAKGSMVVAQFDTATTADLWMAMHKVSQ